MSVVSADDSVLEMQPRYVDAAEEVQESYRALSVGAVVSFVLGLLSILAFADFWLGLIPLLAIVVGALAWRRIAQAPEAYTGRRLAEIGVALGCLFWAGGASWLSYVYLTEVPEGYKRISYNILQPAETDIEGGLPAAAQALDGQRVFIKGYIYPPPGSPPFVTHFLLVRDKGDCCFGGNPKVTDRILVDIKPPDKLEYSQGVHAVAGTFRLQPTQAPDADGEVWYRLEADYAK